MSMFCFQCQEAAGGKGCTVKGVCGKEDHTSSLMDSLMHIVGGIAIANRELRKKEIANKEASRFVIDALFCTITNANFDDSAIEARIKKGIEIRNLLIGEAKKREISLPEIDMKDGHENPQVGVLAETNEDLRSLKQLAVYGVKGAAAYTDHALNLGFEDDSLYERIEHTLDEVTRRDIDAAELVNLVLGVGELGVKAMALLDKANTTAYGNPEITKVNIGVRNNPAILISGHDLRDMQDLLEQTEGTGVDVYTHSEMLPAHYYPAFKKYSHFAGNYGGSWWRQREEFESFNGPILFTTNCIVPPLSKATYTDRVYTTGSSGYPGFPHIAGRTEGKAKDFSVIIEHAKHCAPPKEIETGEIVGGFAHAQVVALADKVVSAVKSGAIRKFVVMGGCDGRMKSRAYYTEFAKALPHDTVILTAGCAKYRYNKFSLGDIEGIPRVLDAGQCNDSYSLAMIALKLKEVFGLEDINDLPIVYNIAWYEQKAVIVLLALLSLGVKKIHLGPTLPAFLSPNVVNVLVDKFGIAGISTVDEDLTKFMS